MNRERPILLSPGMLQAATEAPLVLTIENLARHLFLAGGTGQGKSMLLQLFMRQLTSQGVGYTYVTPHPGTCEDHLVWLKVNNCHPSRVTYLKPGDRTHGVSFNPYADRPAGGSLYDDESWLTATCDEILHGFLRDVAAVDVEVMNRLRRWVENTLVVCGLQVHGEHLGLDNALLLTDPGSPEFEALMEKVGPELRRLRPDVWADFQKLAATRNARQQENWVESTINLFRKMLRPALRQTFGQMAPSLSMRDIIMGSKIQLLNLSKTKYFSREANRKFGGLWINWMMETARELFEERYPQQPVWHVLIIDEAPNYIAEDLGDAFVELRKFRMPVILTVQDLTGLRKGDHIDLQGRVFGQCGLQFTFRQQDPEDLEYFAKSFGYPSLDLTPCLAERTRFKGYMKVPTVSVSIGAGRSVTHSESASETETESETFQTHSAESVQDSISLALSESQTDGGSQSRTKGASKAQTMAENWSNGTSKSEQESHGKASTRSDTESESRPLRGDPTDTKGKALARVENENRGTAIAENHQIGGALSITEQENWSLASGKNWSDTLGKAMMFGAGRGRSNGISEGDSRARSRGKTVGDALGRSNTASLALGYQYLADQETVSEPNGKLVVAAQDQIYGVIRKLARLRSRQLIGKALNMDDFFLLEVWEVLDPYVERDLARGRAWSPGRTMEYHAAELQRYVEQIRSAHAFYFTPNEEARRERLRRFLYGDVEPDANVGDDGPEPPRGDGLDDDDDGPPSSPGKNHPFKL